VKGGDHDLVISVTSNELHTASIRGRVLDEEARPLAKVRVQWCASGSNYLYPLQSDADGRFEAKALQPGTYEVEVMPEGMPARKLSDLKLVRDQVLDLGDVHISGAGQLKVRLHFPPGMDPDHGSPTLILLEPGASIGQSVHLNGDVGTLEGIAPGDYQLKLFNPWLSAPVTAVKIELHRTTEVEVTATIATSRGVKFDLPEGGTIPEHITLRAFDASGTEVYSSGYPGDMKHGLVANLAIGTYRIEASTDTGLSAKDTLKIDSLDIPQSVIELHLR
jgi:hypothetical protein